MLITAPPSRRCSDLVQKSIYKPPKGGFFVPSLTQEMAKYMKKLFIDTDMGIDDVLAILMLLSCKDLEVTGISTVNGVSRAKKGAQNLISILSSLGYPIQVQAGSNKSFVKTDASFPIIDRTRSEQFWNKKFKSQEIIVQRAIENFIFRNFQEEQTLVTLGPLTNIAKTIQKYENRFISQVKQIYLMGGGIFQGNVPGKTVEYNILLDPEAAKIVFESGIPIKMVPVDATRFVPATQEFKELISKKQITNSIQEIIKQIILFNDGDFNYFYDPLLAALLIDSSMITKTFSCSIDISLTDENRGQTLVKDTTQQNVQVISEVKSEKFYSLLANI